MFIIFWDFLMVQQIFASPQMKRSVVISNIRVASRADERLKTYNLRKLWNISIVTKFYRIIAQRSAPSPPPPPAPPRKENPASTCKNHQNWERPSPIRWIQGYKADQILRPNSILTTNGDSKMKRSLKFLIKIRALILCWGHNKVN